MLESVHVTPEGSPSQVITPADYKEYRDAGADAVMSATGAMWNSHLAAEIKDSLA